MFDFIASLLYPKRCVQCGKNGAYICDHHFASIEFLPSQLCGVCQKGSIDGMTHPKCRSKYGIDGIFSSIAYKGIVRKLLYQFKYPPYLSDLKGILGKLLYEGLIQQEAFVLFSSQNALIVSVPLHASREKKRGYNQAEILAKELSCHLKIPYVVNVLFRKRYTTPQFELKKGERATNILGAFDVKKELTLKLKGKHIILVDDITTTGATLRECAKVLKKSGAKSVLGVTLAHEA